MTTPWESSSPSPSPPRRRDPPRLGSQPEPDAVGCRRHLEDGVGQAGQRIGRELLGVRSGHDAQLDRRAGVELGGAARARWSPSGGAQGPACRLRPPGERARRRARSTRRWRCSRTTRARGSRRPPRDRCGTPALAADLEHLAGGERQQLPGRHRRCRRRGPPARRRRRRRGTAPRQRSRVPPPVSSSAPASRALPASAVGQRERHGVGRTRTRDPDRGDPTPATVLDDRPQPGGHHLEDRSRARAATTTAARSPAAAPPARPRRPRRSGPGPPGRARRREGARARRGGSRSGRPGASRPARRWGRRRRGRWRSPPTRRGRPGAGGRAAAPAPAGRAAPPGRRTRGRTRRRRR